MPNQTSSLVFLHYLTTVFDNLDEGIILIGIEPGEHYRYLMSNQAYERITGRKESPVGRLLSEVVAPETLEVLKKQYAQVVRTKLPMSFTQRYRVPLGYQIYEVKLLPILNAVGDVVQIAGIARNVTKIERMHQELKKLRAALKKRSGPNPPA